MKITTWHVHYNSHVIPLEIRLGYGQTRTIYCGDSDRNTPPGDWLHDGKPLGVYSGSYTITTATFDDDGEYQCRRNGSNVFLSPLEVEVYGKCDKYSIVLSMYLQWNLQEDHPLHKAHLSKATILTLSFVNCTVIKHVCIQTPCLQRPPELNFVLGWSQGSYSFVYIY